MNAAIAPACLECGTPVTKRYRGPWPKHCSDACKRRYRNAQVRIEPEKRRCVLCGSDFLSGSGQITRCGDCSGKRRLALPIEHHTCARCSVTWTRKATKGRTPRYCPPCRALTPKQRGHVVDVHCVACSKALYRRDNYYCSKTCAANHREPSKWPSCTVPLSHPCRKPWPRRGPATRVFISDCSECSKTFVSIYTTSTCSVECAKEKRRDKRRVGKDRRRARERSAFVAPVYRKQIYERDKWRCHLCGKLVSKTMVAPHPRAATIDHLLPLASGGTHEPANVAIAHFICNSLKGDRGGGEQLALVG